MSRRHNRERGAQLARLKVSDEIGIVGDAE